MFRTDEVYSAYLGDYKANCLRKYPGISVVKAKTLAPRLIRVNENDLPSSEKYPIIHHTVCERFRQVASYRPYAMRDVKFRIMDAQGRIGGRVYHGISEL